MRSGSTSTNDSRSDTVHITTVSPSSSSSDPSAPTPLPTSPTNRPTPKPTHEPTQRPTESGSDSSPQPTQKPTQSGTESSPQPTHEPTPKPTAKSPTSPPSAYTSQCPTGVQPNIIIFYSDDMGYGDREKYNGDFIKTPVIERIASEGIDFLDGHAASSTCSPSRFAILTGEYYSRYDAAQKPVKGNEKPLLDHSPKDEDGNHVTIATVLKKAGYRSYMLGKYHLGLTIKDNKDYSKGLSGTPTDYGFEHYYGTTCNNDWLAFIDDDYWPDLPVHYTSEKSNYIVSCNSGKKDCKTYDWKTCALDAPAKDSKCKNSIYRQVSKTGWGTHIAESYDPNLFTQRIAEKAIEYIDTHVTEHKSTPFFMHVNWLLPHVPHTAHPDFDGKNPYGAYADVIEEVDFRMGSVLDRIEHHGLTDNTLVIITSDNGAESISKYKSTGYYPCAALHGEKRDLYEGGHRVPMVMKWPGVIPSGLTSDITISQVDFLRTFAEITGAKVSPGTARDSFSFYKAMCNPTGTKQSDVRDNQPFIFTQPKHSAYKSRDGRAVRCGDFKTFWNKKNRRILTNLRQNPSEEDGFDDTKNKGANLIENNGMKQLADALWDLKLEIYKNGHSDKTRCSTIANLIPT